MSGPKMGGFKLSLGSVKNKTAPTAAAAPPAKRAKLLGDDDVEDTDKTVEITGFDTSQGGAIDVSAKKKEEEKPRIIPALPNRDWRAQAQRKQQAQTNGDNIEPHKEPEVKYGLQIMEKQEASADRMEIDSKPIESVDDGLTDEQREEKAALKALLNGDAGDNRIIPAQSEEEAFRQDYENAPEAPDLAAYEAVPIEGFGAALLRGMGWRDSDEHGKNPVKPKEIKRRSALLGIGAKEEAAVGFELGEWGTGKGKNKKMEMSYNPVAIKIKSTGEIITEEEFKKRQEQKKLVEEESEKTSSRREKDRDDGRGKDRKRRDEEDYDSERRRDRKRRDEDYDSERRREKKYRDDDYDSERRRDRKRRDEDDYDSERRREKRKDKYDDYEDDRRKDRRKDDRRDRDKDRERDRDRRHRSRSRGDDYKKERRHRDRKDRTRSPASDDSRKRKRRDHDDDSDRDDRRRRYRDERSSRR